MQINFKETTSKTILFIVPNILGYLRNSFLTTFVWRNKSNFIFIPLTVYVLIDHITSGFFVTTRTNKCLRAQRYFRPVIKADIL